MLKIRGGYPWYGRSPSSTQSKNAGALGKHTVKQTDSPERRSTKSTSSTNAVKSALRSLELSFSSLKKMIGREKKTTKAPELDEDDKQTRKFIQREEAAMKKIKDVMKKMPKNQPNLWV